MKSQLTLLAIASVLATASVACTNMSEEGIVNDEDPLTSANGLSSNGLSSNGLTSNGLSSNGLSSNGLSSNGLSSNGLVMGALRDTSTTGDLTRMFFRYLVSCALPTGHSVSYTWTDSSSMLHTEVNPGGLGLAPLWETGPVDQTGKELVSACLGARVNSKGIVVPLSLRAKNVSALTVTSSERSSYTYGEGSFWGDLFSGSPHIYSCTRAPLHVGIASSSYLSQGRTCTTAACGLIHPLGQCYAYDGTGSGQACYERASNGDYATDCFSQLLKGSAGAATYQVLTVWLMP